MHPRALPPAPDGAPRAVLILFAWLVPVLAFPDYSVPVDETTGRIASRPYLRVATAPALRFGEAPPPPDLTIHLPAGAPPKPENPTPSTEPATEKSNVAKAEGLSADVTVTPPRSAIVTVAETTKAEKEKPAGPPPAPILPDETRPRVRPEDFLPYFTFPGNSTYDAPSAPAPGRQPPSSATYRQQ